MVGTEDLLNEISSNDIHAAADRLIELTKERGAPDNVSVVIVRVA